MGEEGFNEGGGGCVKLGVSRLDLLRTYYYLHLFLGGGSGKETQEAGNNSTGGQTPHEGSVLLLTN